MEEGEEETGRSHDGQETERGGGVIGNIAGNNGSSRYVISCKQRLRFDDSVETAGIIVICGGQRSRFSDGRFPTSCCSWPSLTRV